MTDLTGEAPRQRFCPSCGTQSNIEWRYCAGCGGRLPRLEDIRGPMTSELPPAVEPVAAPEPEPVIDATPEPAVEATAEPAAEPLREPAGEATPEPVVEAPQEPAVETAARQVGPDHASRAAESRRDVRAPLTEPPRHRATPTAEPRGERPRRRRGGSDLIAALIEGPGAKNRDRRPAGDGPDEAADAPEVLIDSTAVDDPQVLIYLTPAVVPDVAIVPDVEAVDPRALIGMPGADEHDDDALTGMPGADEHDDDARGDGGQVGEIHLEPLPEDPHDSDAGALPGSRAGRVTTYVQFAAIVSAALGVTLVAGLVRLNRRLSSFALTGDAGPVEDADRLVERIFQPAFFVAVVVVLAGLVWWTRLRRVDLHALGFRGSRFSDELAAGSWLIPGVNLVLPMMVLDEMCRASRAVRRREEWGDQPANPWLWAWALLMGAGVVVAIAAAAASPSSVAGTIDANTWSGIGYALMSLALLVLVLTISAVATTVRIAVRVAGVEHGRHDVDLTLREPAATG